MTQGRGIQVPSRKFPIAEARRIFGIPEFDGPRIRPHPKAVCPVPCRSIPDTEALASRPATGLSSPHERNDFDALDATGTLRQAGFGEYQAEAVVAVVRASRAGLATKDDLDNLEGRVNARFAELETRLTVRFFGGLFATGGPIVAVMAALELFG